MKTDIQKPTYEELEKRVAELGKENSNLKDKIRWWDNFTERHNERYNRIKNNFMKFYFTRY